MSEQQVNNPLHGVTLKMALTRLVDHYGWENLSKLIDIQCFYNQPTINSSLKYLRKTLWAKQEVEALYEVMIANERRKADENDQ